jgi:hypothetical protein
VSFYGWHTADQFIAAWRAAGFRIVGHIVFRKRYESSVRFLRYEHEAAYLLAKGDAKPPATPLNGCSRTPCRRNLTLREHPTEERGGHIYEAAGQIELPAYRQP